MNDCPTEGWYLCTNMHDDWFGEGQSMCLSFLLHAQFKKKQYKLSVCIGFLLVSNTNRLDAVPSRMGHIHV